MVEPAARRFVPLPPVDRHSKKLTFLLDGGIAQDFVSDEYFKMDRLLTSVIASKSAEPAALMFAIKTWVAMAEQ
ncbi:hypothetical protein PQR67_26750 [Paraburkholderia fungorum]|uniref:hypothetical protein n=1 Tax=Paraburkholderia fungorum TaxID=134537 RepID=UPI0038B92BE3